MRKTIEQVLAEAAIMALQMQYCRGVDRRDYDMIRECFHPDARTVFFEDTDLDGYFAFAREMMPRFSVTTHNTGNQLVEVDGNSAWAEHYCVASHRIPADADGPERDFVTAVRYADRLECRNGDWRILKRLLILDWTRIDPVGDAPPPGVRNGRPDRSDPSYTLER